MKKWEYKFSRAIGTLGLGLSSDLINKLGEEGWEAVGVVYDAKYSQTYVLLKREKT